MSFADDVIEFQKRGTVQKRCNTGAWLESLDDEGRKVFHSYIASGGRVSNLWRLAKRWGCEAGETRFRVHCRRECCCYARQEVAA